MPEKIPGISNSPFSVGGQLNPNSGLAKIIDILGLDEDDSGEAEFMLFDAVVEGLWKLLPQNGLEPDRNNPLLREMVTICGIFIYHNSPWGVQPEPVRKRGRPPLCIFRCFIAWTLADRIAKSEPDAKPAKVDRLVAQALGPGIKGHHVRDARARAKANAARLLCPNQPSPDAMFNAPPEMWVSLRGTAMLTICEEALGAYDREPATKTA